MQGQASDKGNKISKDWDGNKARWILTVSEIGEVEYINPNRIDSVVRDKDNHFWIRIGHFMYPITNNTAGNLTGHCVLMGRPKDE